MCASVQNRLKVSRGCLLNKAVSPCFSSLDLKRKGIGNLFSVQTVQLGCDSRNNAGNKAEAMVALCFCSIKEGFMGNVQDLHKPFLQAVLREKTGFISISFGK